MAKHHSKAILVPMCLAAALGGAPHAPAEDCNANGIDDRQDVLPRGFSFPVPGDPTLGQEPLGILAADLDGDGDADLVTANRGTNDISVLLNGGDARFSTPRSHGAGSSPIAMAAADLDRDGDLDLVTGNFQSSDVSVLLNEGGGFAPMRNHAAGFKPVAVAAGDLDGDGQVDLAVANVDDSQISLLFQDAAGGFALPRKIATGSFPFAVRAVDLDGDRDLDLVTANLFSDGVSVLLNHGDGIFDPEMGFPAHDGCLSVAVADMDGDLDPDLVVSNTDSRDASVLLNLGDGRFARPVHVAAHETPVSVVAADLDGDLDMDIAVANGLSHDITILENESALAFSRDDDADGVPDECQRSAFHRGDPDGNGIEGLTDAVLILRRLFQGEEPFACTESADADNDGEVAVTDAVVILSHLFLGGAPRGPGTSRLSLRAGPRSARLARGPRLFLVRGLLVRKELERSHLSFDRNDIFLYSVDMQTTLRIDDATYREAKAEAARRGVTLTRFIEEALKQEIASCRGDRHTDPESRAEIEERDRLMEALLERTAHFRVGARPTREEMNAR